MDKSSKKVKSIRGNRDIAKIRRNGTGVGITIPILVYQRMSLKLGDRVIVEGISHDQLLISKFDVPSRKAALGTTTTGHKKSQPEDEYFS